LQIKQEYARLAEFGCFLRKRDGKPAFFFTPFFVQQRFDFYLRRLALFYKSDLYKFYSGNYRREVVVFAVFNLRLQTPPALRGERPRQINLKKKVPGHRSHASSKRASLVSTLKDSVAYRATAEGEPYYEGSDVL
jgi:hypothetical protein